MYKVRKLVVEGKPIGAEKALLESKFSTEKAAGMATLMCCFRIAWLATFGWDDEGKPKLPKVFPTVGDQTVFLETLFDRYQKYEIKEV